MDTAETITRQTDHKAENLDADSEDAKKQAELDDFDWAQRQYPSPDPSVYETFLANSVGLPLENPPAEVQNAMHARKRAREDHACGADHVPPNFNDTSIENPESNDSEGVNSNNCQTGLEERHQLTISKREEMTPVLCNVGNTMIFDAAAADAADAAAVLKPAILDQLEKQHSDCFYDFHQHQVFAKLQTAFIASARIHKRNLPPEPLNYC